MKTNPVYEKPASGKMDNTMDYEPNQCLVFVEIT
jgi:hypothetical protein